MNNLKIIMILFFASLNYFTPQNNLFIDYQEFIKMDISNQRKYVNDRLLLYDSCYFPAAAYNFIQSDGGSNKIPYLPKNPKSFVITHLKELQASNYNSENIKNTMINIVQKYGESLFTNYFYQNDEFGEGIYHPFVENYFRFNDSLFLRTLIFFEKRSDIIYQKSNYFSVFNFEKIDLENKFDLHMVLYNKQILINRLKYLKKEYKHKKNFNDYKNQIIKINEFLKNLNSM
jgi:hypothetical protein